MKRDKTLATQLHPHISSLQIRHRNPYPSLHQINMRISQIIAQLQNIKDNC